MMERGYTRSGGQFIKQNVIYHSTYRALKLHHQRLFSEEPRITHRPGYIDDYKGFLVQTTIVYRFDHPNIEESLKKYLSIC